MSSEDVQARNFLSHLYQVTGGEISAEVSMYDIGDALGLNRSEAGSIAEDLIIDGFVELKNLAGGIGITVGGLQALDIAPSGNDTEAGTIITLGDRTIVDEDVARALGTLLLEIKTAVSAASMNYDALEEIVIDLKTLEAQLLSPRPKTSIVREILSSLSAVLAGQKGNEKLAETIRQLAGG